MSRSTALLLALAASCLPPLAPAQDGDSKTRTQALRKAVTLYASFDDDVKADAGGGDLTLWTRTGELKSGKFTHAKGFDRAAFRIAKGKGKVGGALECVRPLKDNGRIYFPAAKNIGFAKGGWSGGVSMWLKTDPNRLIKTKFCDPVQITQKGANDGGIWFDFNDAKPRDLRMGVFPAVPEGKKGVAESDPDAPMVRVPKVTFQADDWHHVALSWKNFDTGKADAVATLWIDGKKIGSVDKRAIAVRWDVEKAGIYVAINYVGLLDEFAVFGTELSESQVKLLFEQPNVLSGVKK